MVDGLGGLRGCLRFGTSPGALLRQVEAYFKELAKLSAGPGIKIARPGPAPKASVLDASGRKLQQLSIELLGRLDLLRPAGHLLCEVGGRGGV